MRIAVAMMLVLLAVPAPARAQPPCQCVHEGVWQRTRPYFFGAGQLDIGVAFLRPRFTIGYGRPFQTWFGLEVNPQASASALSGYGGLKLQVPFLELRAGGRVVLSLRRAFLDPQEEYNSEEFRQPLDRRSTYAAFEAEAEIDIPTGEAGVLHVEGTYLYVGNVPPDVFVYEERLRIVMEPPHAWRVRTAYLFLVGQRRFTAIGPAVEIVGNPDRELIVVQGGLVARMRLWSWLQLRLNFMPPLYTRDQLGIAGGEFGLGLRMRFARPFGSRAREELAGPDDEPVVPEEIQVPLDDAPAG